MSDGQQCGTFAMWSLCVRNYRPNIHALQKNSGLRLDYIHDRFNTNDWTWTTWTYTDGTTLTQNPNQRTNFLGVSYYYKWQ